MSVTVVIPCYNSQKYLQAAIRSVRSQSCEAHIIVVDDGSIDNSAYVARQNGVELIQFEKNLGACAAVNEGFAAVKTDYACILAADDTMFNPYYLEDMVKAIQGFDWCYGSVVLTGRTEEHSDILYSKWLVHPLFDNFLLRFFPSFCAIIMTRRNPVNSSGMLIRMTSYHKHNLSWNPWGLRSVCDGAIISEMLLCGMHGRSVHKPGIFYRLHLGQISNTVMHASACKKASENILGSVAARGNLIMRIIARITQPFFILHMQ